MLLGAAGSLQIIITDCCRMPLGATEPGYIGAGGVALAQRGPVELRGGGGVVGNATDEARSWAFTMREATEKGGPVSRAVLYACGSGEAARTGANGLGVFTGFLISGLEGEAARDGCVMGDLFEHVFTRMAKNKLQKPERVVGGQAGDVVLAQHERLDLQPVTLPGPGGDRRFDTIGQALAQAKSGDTIRLAAGSYYEDVRLTPGVNLVGVGPTKTIIGASAGRIRSSSTE